MSWFQRKRKFKVGQRWRCPLSVEALEDRWVPSTLSMPAALAVQNGEFSASYQHTQILGEHENSENDAGKQSSDDSHYQSQVAQTSHTETAQESAGGDSGKFGPQKNDDAGFQGSSGTPQHGKGAGDDSSTGDNSNQQEHDGSGSPVASVATQPNENDSENAANRSQQHDDGTQQHVGNNGEDAATGSNLSQQEHNDSENSATATQQTGKDGEDSVSSANRSQPEQENSPSETKQTATADDRSTHSASNTGQQVNEEATLQETTLISHGTNSQQSGHDSQTDAETVSADLAEAGSTKTSTQSGAGTVSTLVRTTSTSDGNSDHVPKEGSSSLPGSSTALVARQLDVSQRPADVLVPASGPMVPGNDNHVVFSGISNQGVGIPAGPPRFEGFVPETALFSSGGFAQPERTWGDGFSFPQSTELIGDVLPFDLAALDAAWQNLLANLESCVADLVQLSAQTGLAPLLVAAALAVATLELARRRWNQADPVIGLFEAAGGKAPSGLRHDSTGPQP